MDFKKIIIDKDNLLKVKQNLKNTIDYFVWKINIIMEKLERMKNQIYLYYKINNEIFENYNINKRNYHILQNLQNYKNNNEKLIKELNYINNNNKIFEIISK